MTLLGAIFRFALTKDWDSARKLLRHATLQGTDGDRRDSVQVQ